MWCYPVLECLLHFHPENQSISLKSRFKTLIYFGQVWRCKTLLGAHPPKITRFSPGFGKITRFSPGLFFHQVLKRITMFSPGFGKKTPGFHQVCYFTQKWKNHHDFTRFRKNSPGFQQVYFFIRFWKNHRVFTRFVIPPGFVLKKTQNFHQNLKKKTSGVHQVLSPGFEKNHQALKKSPGFHQAYCV